MEKDDGKRSEEVVQVGLQIKYSGVTQEHRVFPGDLLSNQQSKKSEDPTQINYTQLNKTDETHKEIHQEKEKNTQEQNTLIKSKENETFSQEHKEFEEDKELKQKASVGISVLPKHERPSETFIQEHRELPKVEELEQKAVADIMVRQKDERSANKSFVTKEKFIQTAQDDAVNQERYVLPKGLLNAGQKIAHISVLEQDTMEIAQTEDKEGIHQEFVVFEGNQFNADGICTEQKVVKTSERILHAPVQESIHIIQQEGNDTIPPEFDAHVDDLMKPTSEINFTRESKETLKETIPISVEYPNQKVEQEPKEAVQQANDLNSENDAPLQAVASNGEISIHPDANPSTFKPTTIGILLRPPPPGCLDPNSRMYQCIYGTQKRNSFSSSRTRPDRPEIVQFQNRPTVPEEDRPQGEDNADGRGVERNGEPLEASLPPEIAELYEFARKLRVYQFRPKKPTLQSRCLELLYGLLACGILFAMLYWLVVLLEKKYDTDGSNITSSLTNMNDN